MMNKPRKVKKRNLSELPWAEVKAHSLWHWCKLMRWFLHASFSSMTNTGTWKVFQPKHIGEKSSNETVENWTVKKKIIKSIATHFGEIRCLSQFELLLFNQNKLLFILPVKIISTANTSWQTLQKQIPPSKVVATAEFMKIVRSAWVSLLFPDNQRCFMPTGFKSSYRFQKFVK